MLGSPAAWWIVPLAVAVLLVSLAAAPGLLQATGRTSRLDRADRRTLAAGLWAHGEDGRPVPPALTRDGGGDGDSEPSIERLLDTVRVLDTDAPLAFAVGLVPPVRRVVVSAGLLRALPPAEAAAVVRHEHAHLVRHHTLARVGLPSTFVIGWGGAVGLGLPGAFVGGLVLVPLAAVGAALVSRWSEYDADALAAAQAPGAGPALARGLTRLDADDGRDDPRRRRFLPGTRLLSRHPPTTDRVARLRSDHDRGAGEPSR
jgi:hypothetical protein